MPLAAFSETVASIFNAVADDKLIPTAMQAVTEYVGAASTAWLIINKLTGKVSSRVSWGSFAGRSADYLGYYSKIDRYRLLLEGQPCGKLVRLSEALPESYLAYDEWYNDFIRAGGSSDLFFGKLAETESRRLIFGIHRAFGDAHSFPRNIDALNALLPPLCAAARMRLRWIDAELGQNPMGMLFVGADGEVVEMNHAAEHILSIGDGLKLRDGNICAHRSFETARLIDLIANATNSTAPAEGCTLVARESGRPAYVVKIVPVGAQLVGYDLPTAVIFISAPGGAQTTEQELQQLYGLSRSESRLATALWQGKRMPQLPAEFGVRITTLRTQLSSILKKCGVERQSDLAGC